MISITMPAAHLSAVKLFASKQDVRYYLNGVCFEIGRYESQLAATNGHVLAVLRVESDQPSISEPLRVIIPLEGLAHVKKKGDVTVSVGSPADEYSNAYPVTVEAGGVSWSGLAIDGSYPDWRRLVPRELSGEAAQYNPDYVIQFQTAGWLLHQLGRRAGVAIGHNGLNAAVVDVGIKNFFGIIMPQQAPDVEKAPAWAARGVNLPPQQVAA